MGGPLISRSSHAPPHTVDLLTFSNIDEVFARVLQSRIKSSMNNWARSGQKNVGANRPMTSTYAVAWCKHPHARGVLS